MCTRSPDDKIHWIKLIYPKPGVPPNKYCSIKEFYLGGGGRPAPCGIALRSRSLRWKNKPKHCSGWFVAREKYYFSWKNKLKSTDYKTSEQDLIYKQSALSADCCCCCLKKICIACGWGLQTINIYQPSSSWKLCSLAASICPIIALLAGLVG